MTRINFCLSCISLSLLVLLISSASAQQPCSQDYLSNYIKNKTACTLGSVTVSNFRYRTAAAGGASTVPASKIWVVPFFEAQDGLGFGPIFLSLWSLAPGQSRTTAITFSVSGTLNSPSVVMGRPTVTGYASVSEIWGGPFGSNGQDWSAATSTQRFGSLTHGVEMYLGPLTPDNPTTVTLVQTAFDGTVTMSNNFEIAFTP
jgi:hypothetical protein